MTPNTNLTTLLPALDWEQVLGLLRHALHLSEEIVCPKPGRLGNSLQGSGFYVQRFTPINNLLPAHEDQHACLLEADDGTWLILIGNGSQPLLLNYDGTPVLYEAEDFMPRILRAFIIYQPVAKTSQAMLPLLYRHKGRLFDIFLCGLVINLFAFLLPLFSSFVYDKILGNGATETLWTLAIGLGLVMLLELGIRMIRVRIAEQFAISSEADIDHSTFRNLLHTPANTMPGIGAFLEKYKQVLGYRDFLSSSYLLAMADLPFLLLFLLAIAAVSGPLVLVGLVCGGLMLVVNLLATLPVFDYERQARTSSEKRFGLVTDVLYARDAIVGEALPAALAQQWRKASLAAIQSSSAARYWRGMGASLTNSLSSLSYAAVIVGGVYMVEDRTLTSGGLLAASMLTSRVMANFASVVMLVTRAREFRTAMHELNKILPATSLAKSQTHYGKLQGSVRLNKITCQLRAQGQPVLNQLNLHVAAGEMVGIAGPPGAGKTTLLRLIAGTLVPQEGQVLLDNIPLPSLSPEDVSLNIGFKPQDPCLLDGTLEDNIRAGRPPLDAAVRTQILQTSGLARNFADGSLNWTTAIGSRGSNLSGGQRQLVALARAMLGNPTLLLLDEPSNGLDAELESNLIRYLLTLKGRHTLLLSTHSRSLLSICDRIIVIGEGRIIADGPRERVLAA